MKNRTLKRPMFRKGGPAMEGIMTGIKPREKFQGKGASDEVITQSKIPNLNEIQNYINLGRKVIPRESGMSKLSDFLLEFGPALATNPSSGSIFTDLNRAAKKPAQSLIVKKQADRALDTQLALQGLKGLSKQSLIALEKKINLAVQSGRYGDPNDPKTRKKVTGLFLNKELEGVNKDRETREKYRREDLKELTSQFSSILSRSSPETQFTTGRRMAELYLEKIKPVQDKFGSRNQGFILPSKLTNPRMENGTIKLTNKSDIEDFKNDTNKQFMDIQGNVYVFTGMEFTPIGKK